MKTVIYFMRHGEVDNPRKIIYGRLPGFNITREAKGKIAAVARDFKDKNIDFLYASPMRRTRQTAGIIADKIKLAPIISRLLIETKLYCAGMSLEKFKKDIQPHLYEDKYMKLGQESVASQAQRMMKFVKMVVYKHPGKRILAVTHGDPIVILKAFVENIPFTWQYKRDNYVLPGHFITLMHEGHKYKFE